MAENNNIDDIPADVETVMTEVLQRAFRMAKCDPTCHVCDKKIIPGDNFTLATIDNIYPYGGNYLTDEMVCGRHTSKDLEQIRQNIKDETEAKRLEAIAYEKKWRSQGKSGPGYSRPSKKI